MQTKMLDMIKQWPNFDYYPRERDEINYPGVFVVSDHNAVLPIIWAALKDKVFKKPPLLVRFDAHSDMKYLNIANTKGYPATFESPDEVLLYANKVNLDTNHGISARTKDGAWLTHAIELGFVGDVISFYLKETDHRPTTYKDHCGIEHRLFNYGNLREMFLQTGTLSHKGIEDETNELWEKLRLDSFYDSSISSKEQKQTPIWFDIDLDFATHWLEGFDNMPWRQRDFEKEFIHSFDEDRSYNNVIRLIGHLLKLSPLMTIALEPNCSCGYLGVSEILSGLDYVFSDIDYGVFGRINGG